MKLPLMLVGLFGKLSDLTGSTLFHLFPLDSVQRLLIVGFMSRTWTEEKNGNMFHKSL